MAFIGRSNVGKSSLLNGLVGASPSAPLAFTSSKPGCTRLLNGFAVTSNKLILVDLPGYGYASRHLWGSQVYKYLSRRRTFCRAFLLIDAEHGIKPYDHALLEDFVTAGVSFQIVLSKADKVPHDDELLRRVDEVKSVLQTGFGDAAAGSGGGGGGRGAGKLRGGLGEVLVTAAGGTWTGKRARVVEGLRDVRWAAAVAAGLDMQPEVEVGLGMEAEAGRSN